MKTKKIVFIIITSIIASGVVSFFALRRYMSYTKAEMVFNETEPPFEELLDKGLPDGKDYYESMENAIKKLLGFDVKEPYTVMKSYSSVFDETVDDEYVQAEETQVPLETDKPRFPEFSQIAVSTGISVSNATDYSVDPDMMCGEPLYIKPDGDGPQILIIHTHTTECYDGDNMPGEGDRTTDEQKNMVRVGEEMKKIFEENGIECVHDTTVHDYPTYQGAYTREMATQEKNLSQYPSIKLVFDVHRDAFVYEDGSKLKVECDINGVPTAKVMIVCGTDAMGLSHPYWRENFKLAAKIQNAAQIMYPGMMRPINLRRERFNMHTTTGSLLFEVGSNGNTLSEAIEGGKNIANAVSAVLINQ